MGDPWKRYLNLSTRSRLALPPSARCAENKKKKKKREREREREKIFYRKGSQYFCSHPSFPPPFLFPSLSLSFSLPSSLPGQVHRARLRDGRDVAVKVKYPYVERVFESDMSTIETFCRLAQPEQVRVCVCVCMCNSHSISPSLRHPAAFSEGSAQAVHD